MGVHRTLVKHIRKIIFILSQRTRPIHPTPMLAWLRRAQEDRGTAPTSSSDSAFGIDLHLCRKRKTAIIRPPAHNAKRVRKKICNFHAGGVRAASAKRADRLKGAG